MIGSMEAVTSGDRGMAWRERARARAVARVENERRVAGLRARKALDAATGPVAPAVPPRPVVRLACRADVTAPDIVAWVAAVARVSSADITGPSRRRPLVRARALAMLLHARLIDPSPSRIGAALGRDQSTVRGLVARAERVFAGSLPDDPDALFRSMFGGEGHG